MAKLIIEVAPGKITEKQLIAGKQFVIGRRKQSDLVIGDSRASRTHAIIAGKGRRFVIKDNGSSNGTAVNGNRIETLELSDGDIISIGGLEMTFRLDGGPAAVGLEEAMEALRKRMLLDLDAGPLPALPGEAGSAPVPAAPGPSAAGAVAADLGEELGEDLVELDAEVVEAGPSDSVAQTHIDSVAAELAAELGEEIEELEELSANGDASPLAPSVEAGGASDLAGQLEQLTEDLDEAIEGLTTIEEVSEIPTVVGPVATGGGDPELDADDLDELEELPPAGAHVTAEPDSVAADLAEEVAEELEEIMDEDPSGGEDQPDEVGGDLARELGEDLEEIKPADEASDENEEAGAVVIELEDEKAEEDHPAADADDEAGSGGLVIELGDEDEIEAEEADEARPDDELRQPEHDEVAAGVAEELGEELEELEELPSGSDEEPAADADEPEEVVEDLEELTYVDSEGSHKSGVAAVAASLGEEPGGALDDSVPADAEADGHEEFISAEQTEDDAAPPDDESGDIDVFAAVENESPVAGAVAAGAAAVADDGDVVDLSELEEAIESVKDETKEPAKKPGKSSREQKVKGTSKRASRRLSQRSTRRESASGQAPSEGAHTDALTVKIIAVIVMVFCVIGILVLGGKLMSRQGGGGRRVIRQQNQYVSKLSEADRLINEGHKAMREGRHADAVTSYTQALDGYESASKQYSGDGYGYLQDKITQINGWLRDAREKKFIDDMRRARGGT